MPRTRTRARLLRARIVGDLNINALLAYGFGIVYLAVAMWLATTKETLDPDLWQVMKVVLALAAAGVGAVIPGTIIVDVKGIVRAGGAIALFTIVYFFPAATIPGKVEAVGGLTAKPTSSGLQTVSAWLALLDAGLPHEAWAQLATEARITFPEAEFIQLYSTVRKPYGKLSTRSLINSDEMKNPPAYPPGIYRLYGWSTEFETRPAYESVILVPQNGVWRVFRYSLKPKTGLEQ